MTSQSVSSKSSSFRPQFTPIPEEKSSASSVSATASQSGKAYRKNYPIQYDDGSTVTDGTTITHAGSVAKDGRHGERRQRQNSTTRKKKNKVGGIRHRNILVGKGRKQQTFADDVVDVIVDEGRDDEHDHAPRGNDDQQSVGELSTVFSVALQHSTTSARKRVNALARWGIPTPFSNTPPEIILNERLIWVRYYYKDPRRSGDTFYWWPAILYLSYGEVQSTRVWPEVPVSQRVPLAILTAFSPQSPRAKCKVARLLGRRSIELIELQNSALDTVDFAWELPQQLQRVACNLDAFKEHPTLYYDWHAAMDQVEALLWEFMGHNLTLSNSSNAKSKPPSPGSYPPKGKRTWVQRARKAEEDRWKAQHPFMSRWWNCACTNDLEVPTTLSQLEESETK